ncbi:MAG TPA: hypothetical protein VK620_37190, partial [Bradyrhizobium sp.]|nr:hypothetical protein [Bradyrhizobium sp.]
TLNRLELSRETATRYHKIAHDPARIEGLFVTLFLEAHKMRIPIYSGRVFRREAGHRSDLKPATIPK